VSNIVEDQQDTPRDWRSIADARLGSKFGLSPKHLRAVEAEVADAARSTALSELAPTPVEKRSGLEQLAAALGWTTKKLYRHIHLMPGVEKLDPTKKRSHFHVPDPADSARRWNSGERRRA
jgi:hypothetical protein